MAYKFSTEDIETALRNHMGYVYLAAQSLGCSAKTIYNRLNSVKSLQEVLDEIRGKELDQTELKLHEAIMNGEPWAIKFKLQMQGRERGYVESKEVTGAGGGAVVFEVVYSDEVQN